MGGSVMSKVRIALAILIGLLAFLALFPFSGNDSDPQTFSSVFGYPVPFGGIWLALAAGLVASAVTWFVLGRRGNPNKR